jgi:pimeloyl-ACP methyl ester carboxylesterase
MAYDLAAVLDAVGESQPVVLVAHSWGGPIVRAFARGSPDRVAGVVLVDASLAAVTATRTQVLLGGVSFRIASLLVRMGATSRVIRMVLPHGHGDEFSDDDMTIVTRDYASVRAMRTGVREMKEVLRSRDELEAWERAGLPDVPVVALQGGRVEKGKAARRLRDDFNRHAVESLAHHPCGRVAVVAGAGHLIPQERPGAVVDAILQVIAEADRSR